MDTQKTEDFGLVEPNLKQNLNRQFWLFFWLLFGYILVLRRVNHMPNFLLCSKCKLTYIQFNTMQEIANIHMNCCIRAADVYPTVLNHEVSADTSCTSFAKRCQL